MVSEASLQSQGVQPGGPESYPQWSGMQASQRAPSTPARQLHSPVLWSHSSVPSRAQSHLAQFFRMTASPKYLIRRIK